jgi:hypothetical protein
MKQQTVVMIVQEMQSGHGLGEKKIFLELLQYNAFCKISSILIVVV